MVALETTSCMEDRKKDTLIQLQTNKANQVMLGKGSILSGAALPSCLSLLP